MRNPLLTAALLVLLTAAQAHANLVAYEFVGTVGTVSPAIAGANTPYGFAVGQPITGSFTYDIDAVTVLSYFGTRDDGWSNNHRALTAFTMKVGSYTADDPTVHPVPANIVQVLNTPARDAVIMSAVLDSPTIGGFHPIGFLSLDTPLPDRMLAHVGDLSGVPSTDTFWYLAFSAAGGDPRLTGRFSSVTVIPEPSTLALFGLGFGLLAWQLRRGRKAA